MMINSNYLFIYVQVAAFKRGVFHWDLIYIKIITMKYLHILCFCALFYLSRKISNCTIVSKTGVTWRSLYIRICRSREFLLWKIVFLSKSRRTLVVHNNSLSNPFLYVFVTACIKFNNNKKAPFRRPLFDSQTH